MQKLGQIDRLDNLCYTNAITDQVVNYWVINLDGIY